MSHNSSIVSAKIAVLLKKKGFNEATQYYYTNQSITIISQPKRNFMRMKHNCTTNRFAAPTIDEIKDWLEIKYNIKCYAYTHCEDVLFSDKPIEYNPCIYKNDNIVYFDKDDKEKYFSFCSRFNEKGCFEGMFDYILNKLI